MHSTAQHSTATTCRALALQAQAVGSIYTGSAFLNAEAPRAARQLQLLLAKTPGLREELAEANARRAAQARTAAERHQRQLDAEKAERRRREAQALSAAQLVRVKTRGDFGLGFRAIEVGDYLVRIRRNGELGYVSRRLADHIICPIAATLREVA